MRGNSWESWKLAHAYHRIGSGTTPTSANADYYDDESGMPWITTSELRETYIQRTSTNVTLAALKEFPSLRPYAPNSVFMAMYGGGTIGRLGISTVPATCNQACCVFESSPNFDNRFLFYWLWHRRAELISLAVGGGQHNLSQQDLKSERALCPTLATQRRIAAFLDEKTAQIDGLIVRKQVLLERLTEKRQAIITQAVTKGLNPAGPMKDSGIDWLGQIPAHWEVIALNKVTTKITNGYVGPTRDLFVDEGIRYLQSLHIKGNRIIFSNDFFVEKEWSDQHAKSILKTGDVLVVQTGDIGQVASVSAEYEGCNCHALIICSPVSDRLDGRYLAWLFNSDYGQEFLHMVKTGALHPHLNCGNVKFFNVLIPPLTEQGKIADYVDQQRAKLEVVTAKITDSIAALQDYRSALITSAVTGQIEGLL